MLKFKRSKKGFTLVELMVVVVIIGILTAIAIPVYNSVTSSAQTKACQANQRSILSAISMYVADEGDYPSSGDMASLQKYIQQDVNTFYCPSDNGESKKAYTFTVDKNNKVTISCPAGKEGHNLPASSSNNQ